MNALARYLLVFLLGWSGAVFTYADLIYSKKDAPLNEQGVLPGKETNEALIQTEDVSANKEPKLPLTAESKESE